MFYGIHISLQIDYNCFFFLYKNENEILNNFVLKKFRNQIKVKTSILLKKFLVLEIKFHSLKNDKNYNCLKRNEFNRIYVLNTVY